MCNKGNIFFPLRIKSMKTLHLTNLRDLFYANSSLWMCPFKGAVRVYPFKISISQTLANLHLQVPTQLPLQGSDDLISPSKDDFQRRGRFALPPYSLFSELPSQFSSLHSQSACVVLLTPAVRTHT